MRNGGSPTASAATVTGILPPASVRRSMRLATWPASGGLLASLRCAANRADPVTWLPRAGADGALAEGRPGRISLTPNRASPEGSAASAVIESGSALLHQVGGCRTGSSACQPRGAGDSDGMKTRAGTTTSDGAAPPWYPALRGV